MTEQSKLARLAPRIARLERIVALIKAIYRVQYHADLTQLQAELKAEVQQI